MTLKKPNRRAIVRALVIGAGVVVFVFSRHRAAEARSRDALLQPLSQTIFIGDQMALPGLSDAADIGEVSDDLVVRVYDLPAWLRPPQPVPPPATPAPTGWSCGFGKQVEPRGDDDVEDLSSMITYYIDPNSWQGGGTAPSIMRVHRRLVITQTPGNHARIRQLLNEVQSVGDAKDRRLR